MEIWGEKVRIGGKIKIWNKRSEVRSGDLATEVEIWGEKGGFGDGEAEIWVRKRRFGINTQRF